MKTYLPSLPDVFETLIEGINEEIPEFELNFTDIGSFEDGRLKAGLGQLAILKSTDFKPEELEWIGIVKRTGIKNIKEFILAVDLLESGDTIPLCKFYGVGPIDHPKWLIRDPNGIKENAKELLIQNLKLILEKLRS